MKSVLNLLTFQIRGQQRIEKSVNPSFSWQIYRKSEMDNGNREAMDGSK
jgi:hypothetical protein